MSDLSYTQEQEMNLRDYVRVLFRQKMVILTSFFVVMIIVAVGLALRTPTYEASVKMLVSAQKQVDAPYYKELMGAQQLQASLTQSEIATSEPVLQRVVKALRLYNKPIDYEKKYATPLKTLLIKLQAKMRRAKEETLPESERKVFAFRRAVEELRGSIKVQPIKETNLFTITVSDYDRIGSAIIANVVSRSYVMYDLEQQMAELQMKYGGKHPVVVQLQDNLKQMSQGLNGKPLQNADAIGPASVKIIEQANIPLQPVSQKNKLIFIAALFGSLFLGVILAFIFEFIDQSIKSPREIETILDVPFLGSIPKTKLRKDMFIDGVLNKRLSKRFVSAVKDLADQVHLLLKTHPFKTLYLATADNRDGESIIAANLAYQMAEHAGKRTLIIDANFRQSALPKVFTVPSTPGLVDILTGQAKPTDVTRSIGGKLSIITAGQTNLNPVTFLDTPAMKQLLTDLKSQYDLILVTCAELRTYQDGQVLSGMVDQTILVVTEDETRKQVAAQAVANLKERNIPLLGAFLNKRTYPIPRFIYDRV